MNVPFESDRAYRNLVRGVKKMNRTMSPAARVRRDFRLGRYPKSTLPLHPSVVWQKTVELIADFRQRMVSAGLKPEHVDATLVYIREANPDEPHFSTFVEGRDAAMQRLTADTVALGLVFRQFDEKEKKQVDFPYQFSGLNERGIAVLRKAVELQQKMSKLTSSAN